MKFDIDKVTTKEEDVSFFTEHDTEVIATCMRICPITDGLSDDDRFNIRIRAMNIVATEHNYGQFKNLCDTCKNEFSTCDSDPMFGQRDNGDNICYCESYKQVED